MKAIDVIMLPIFLFLAYMVGYFFKFLAVDKVAKKFFIPALSAKLLGGISVGLAYHFYYRFGDTLRFHWNSTIISENFYRDPGMGMRMIFTQLINYDYQMGSFFTDFMVHNYDESSYFVVRLAGLFGIMAFHSYYGIAIMFALVSFSGVWMAFKACYETYPELINKFALAVLFVPSVFFWGSGILKDTITFSALGWLFWAIIQFITKRKIKIVALVLSSMVIGIIKIYILHSVLLAIVVLIYISLNSKLKSALVKMFLQPIILIVVLGGSFFAFQQLGKTNERFSAENISNSAYSLANEQVWKSEADGAKSGYTLGSDPLDFSLTGVLIKLPLSLNVTFFRPYLWEVGNPVMLMAALESLVIFLFFINIIRRNGIGVFFRVNDKYMIGIFSLVFSLVLAAAVGMTANNFGTLVRYKIPCMPFFLIALILMDKKGNEEYMRKKLLKRKNRYEIPKMEKMRSA